MIPALHKVPWIGQVVHILDRRPLHLDLHIEQLDRASRALFGRPYTPNPRQLTTEIVRRLDADRYPNVGSLFIHLRLDPAGTCHILPGEVSLYRGYTLRALRPRAAVVRYDLPWGEYPTSVREAARQLARLEAERSGAQVALRLDGEGMLCACDETPLFFVRGVQIVTPPAPESVERQLALHVIEQAGLSIEESAVPCESLATWDELFAFDHRGLTSLASCDGTIYMDIIAHRIARELAVQQ